MQGSSLKKQGLIMEMKVKANPYNFGLRATEFADTAPMKYILPGFKKGLWGRSCIHIFHSEMFYSTDDGQIVLLHFDEMDQDTICVNSECVLMLTICSGTFTPLSSAFLKNQEHSIF